MAFDAFTSYATAVRYPRPGGAMPVTPEDDDLQSGIAEVSALVEEIEEWCKDLE